MGWRVTLEHAAPLLKQAQLVVSQVMSSGDNIVLVTPRCATAIATLPVIMKCRPNAMVLWLDAHGDLNTPEITSSSYLGGMPLAAAIGAWDSGYGSGLPASQLIHIGARDFGIGERALINSVGIKTMGRAEIRDDLDALRKAVSGKEVFIHLDTDVFDPSEVVAEYAEPKGLYRQDVAHIFQLIANECNLIGIEITELSPNTEAERVNSYEAVLTALAPLRETFIN